MRAKLIGTLMAAGAITGAAPLRADVTAQYVNGDGRPIRTIEVDDRGNVRVGSDENGYYLATPSGEYLVEPGPGGPKVTSLDTAIVLAAPDLRDRRIYTERWHYEPIGAVQVGPWRGLAYKAAGPGLPPRPPAPVMSQDPRLRPVGRAVLQAARAEFAAARRPDAEGALAPLLEHGALLSDSYRRLGTVSFDPIPPERFELPAKPITLADVSEVELDEQPYNPAGPEIVQAVFADRELWTLDDRGGLGRTPEGGVERVTAEAPEYAVSICHGRAGLWLATQKELGDPVRLWLRAGGAGWEAHGQEPVSRDAWLLGIECSDEQPFLLFSDKLVVGNRTIPLQLTVLPRRLAARPRLGLADGLVLADGALNVAIDNGEWGGGIHRIDLRTGDPASAGRTQFVCVRARFPEVCSGVSGLAPDPGNSGCLLASVASFALGPYGEVVRVCGTASQRIYRKPYTMDPDWSPDEAGATFNNSVAFWRMTGGKGAWALGDDGVYRFGGGAPEFHRFPPVRPGMIDWSHPGIVLVPTDMNGRASRSGGSLLLVRR